MYVGKYVFAYFLSTLPPILDISLSLSLYLPPDLYVVPDICCCSNDRANTWFCGVADVPGGWNGCSDEVWMDRTKCMAYIVGCVCMFVCTCVCVSCAGMEVHVLVIEQWYVIASRVWNTIYDICCSPNSFCTLQLDALHPAITVFRTTLGQRTDYQAGLDALSEAVQVCLNSLELVMMSAHVSLAMLQAAKAGAAATVSMEARAGRASYVHSSQLKQPDPGAQAVTVWLKAIHSAFYWRMWIVP